MPRLVLIFLLFVGVVSPVVAHNVVSGVYAEGMTIEGEIGFSNGDMAQAGFTVEVFDESGNVLGTTETQEGGMFSFKASNVQKHVFRADLGEGHIANMELDADELFADDQQQQLVSNMVTEVGASMVSETVNSDSVVIPGNNISTDELQNLIRSAVAQQVRPLQKDIRAYKEKVFIRDIMGGLGFIFGLFGVAAWMASRRKEASS